jgi:protein-L-isoaspartate(D-aspartate) O-methyltransferase
MALMLEQLELQPGQRVLEIGAGTGYNAAMLAELVGPSGQVTTLDIDPEIADQARERLAAAGYPQVQVVHGDGGFGYPPAAPYERIILTASAADILPAWYEQLKAGGRLVLPLALHPRSTQLAACLEKTGDHLISISINECGFMPLRGAFAGPALVHTTIGPNNDLFMETPHLLPGSPGAYAAWLDGPYRDTDTQVDLDISALFEGLLVWLALQLPEFGNLVARGDLADQDRIPPLAGMGGERKAMTSVVLASATGFAALMRQPGRPVPLLDLPAFFNQPGTFRLFVRSFGADEGPAQRLADAARAWEAAGRPAGRSLKIQAFPKNSQRLPDQTQFLVEMPSVWLALNYQ